MKARPAAWYGYAGLRAKIAEPARRRRTHSSARTRALRRLVSGKSRVLYFAQIS